MSLIILSLVTTLAFADDLNGDDCEDVFFDANGACVATTATVESGATIGASSTVGELTTVGSDTAIGANVVIGSRSTLVGRAAASGARPVGAGTVIGRQVFIDADQNIGVDNTISRAVTAGERLDTGSDVAIGYGATLGDDVTLIGGAYLGNLVNVGNNTTVNSTAVLARGVTVIDSDTSGVIGGTIGPGVSIGADNNIDDSARIRKNATLGDDVTVLENVRIAHDAVIGDGVILGANVRIGARAQVTATTVVAPGTVIGRGDVLDDPSIVSQFNTVSFNPTNTANGCAYQGSHALLYENVGSMNWKSCMSAAAQRGAAVSSNVYTNVGSGSTSGWSGHRNGTVAMYTSSWQTYTAQSITNSRACVLAKDPRSNGISATLSSSTTFDGDTWKYQDYGSQYYDQCILLAANAGASVITPYTIGQTGNGYWLPSGHTCNVQHYSSSNGNSYVANAISGGQRSARRPCMVGYLDQAL